ncbi:MAG: mechanosensitive ion channel [Kiritimatiellia bacterium]
METVRQFINPFLTVMGKYLPSFVGAIIVLVAGLFGASLLRKALKAALGKLAIDVKLEKATGQKTEIEALISGLIHAVIVVFILLLTLDILGIHGVLDPLKEMFSKIMGMLPNMVAAGLIGFLGYILAKMLSGIVGVVTKKLDTAVAKIGLSEKFSPSNLLKQLVFIFVFVPVLVSALDALKIESISAPATRMIESLIGSVPNIIAAALIMGIAYIAALFAANFTSSLLRNMGADELPAKFGAVGLFTKTKVSKLCGGVLFFFIILGAGVSAAEKLGFNQVATLLGQLLGFAGNVVLSLVIIIIGNCIASAAAKALSKEEEKSIVPCIVRIAILGLVLAMGLRTLGVANEIVNLAFMLTLGALAVTIALAFGLGGREAAGKQMEYWLRKLRPEDDKS